MSDELARSAAGRADAPGPEPDRPAPAAPPGEDLLWAYCVVRAGEAIPDGLAGVGERIERIEHLGLAAVVSRVPAADFNEATLTDSLNDLDWLARVARAHESVLERVGDRATLVPLRLCTLFGDEARVREMLAQHREALEAALLRLDDCQEWTVKLLLDPEHATGAVEGPAMPGEMSTGTAYLLRRRAERDRLAAAEQRGREIAEHVHARLQDWAVDAVVRPPQNPELSGHTGDMVLNGAYLVERARADELRALVADLQEQHRAGGARLELGGPLPPFNFVAPLEEPSR